ncbi:MAG: translation elongation factor Ts [Candidatus Levybacteria bacterium CG2_30_37_29]|nr:MAG: translation elongation factor Ts [Candidatus Levybacteria bacterium CG2_30_37_29]
MVNTNLIKELRDKTSAGIADCRVALEEANGDIKKATEILQKKGFEKAAKKSDRQTGEGLVESYIHQTGKVGVLISLLCETDFVARTDEFKTLAHEIAMQIAAMNPKDSKSLLSQEYIRDGSKTINDLIQETIAKLGENIKIGTFSRIQISK